MINNMNFLTIIFYIMVGIMFVLALALAFVYINMKAKERIAKEEEEKALVGANEVKSEKKSKTFNVASVFDFMDFDKIEDNMIVQKKGLRYVMVIECQGVNYDLMSEEEKVGVEEGFVQFLNTINHPVQLYTQTRKINLEASLQAYKAELNKIEQEYNKQRLRYQSIISSPRTTEKQRKEALYEFTKDKNLYEYGKDVITTTEKMSLNRNILNKKYYIAIPYFSEELGQNDYDKNEIREMAFSELYTRARSLIRTLSVTGVIGKVLSSTELADLLYFAYNRDEAEVFGVDKAIRAGYDELYSTAPDYMDKKMAILDKQINDKATRLAGSKVAQVQSEKQKEYEKKVETEDDIINSLAQLIIEENQAMLGKDVAEKAKDKIRKERKADVQKEAKK